jgi:hypothetical protein
MQGVGVAELEAWVARRPADLSKERVRAAAKEGVLDVEEVMEGVRCVVPLLQASGGHCPGFVLGDGACLGLLGWRQLGVDALPRTHRVQSGVFRGRIAAIWSVFEMFQET